LDLLFLLNSLHLILLFEKLIDFVVEIVGVDKNSDNFDYLYNLFGDFDKDYLFDIENANQPNEIQEISEWHNQDLNDKQKSAVQKMLSAPDICLIQGPPGTGKTMIAKAIASECGSTFFNISASSLTSKWVGESEKTVKSLFKIAYQKVPSIIFIDEIDSILSKRSESENEATKRLKTEFLIQFDGLGSNTSARLLVIAATNRPMDLDEALLRRLPKRVYCGPLDEDGRFEFIKKVINRVETDLSDEDIREIAKMTNDYSNSDLMELCREAAYKPVRELTNEEIMKLDKFRPINKKDLVDAAHKIRGTLSKKVKDELRKWNEQFGGV